MGKELNKDYYNRGYKTNKEYFKSAKELPYYENWLISYNYIKKNNIKNIVDLGCGPGHFPTIFEKNQNINYLGIDFSDVSISQAMDKKYEIGNNINYEIRNLKDCKLKDFDCDLFVSFEFLEHISFDIELLKTLNKGDQLIFSVPSFDSPGHVRFFSSEKEIEKRYDNAIDLKLLNISETKRKKKLYLYYGIKK